MKKRVLSALLVLCMACSMVSTVWATETNATSGAPEAASQAITVDPVEATVATGENAATPRARRGRRERAARGDPCGDGGARRRGRSGRFPRPQPGAGVPPAQPRCGGGRRPVFAGKGAAGFAQRLRHKRHH